MSSEEKNNETFLMLVTLLCLLRRFATKRILESVKMVKEMVKIKPQKGKQRKVWLCYLLCFISWTARQGQLEHMRENMRTTMINIPELSTGGVTTSSCWMLVNRSRDATSCSRFC